MPMRKTDTQKHEKERENTMFDSGITAKDLILELSTEADVAKPIPNTAWVRWLNEIEQKLYLSIIKEQGQTTANVSAPTGTVNLAGLTIPTDEAPIRFEDVHVVYAGSNNAQLLRSTTASGSLFPDTYYKLGNDLGYNMTTNPGTLKIIYFVKPKIKTVTNGAVSSDTVKLPYEWLDMVRARLRGEAFKLVNEDATAAKWLNDFNIYVPNFQAWCDDFRTKYGI